MEEKSSQKVPTKLEQEVAVEGDAAVEEPEIQEEFTVSDLYHIRLTIVEMLEDRGIQPPKSITEQSLEQFKEYFKKEKQGTKKFKYRCFQPYRLVERS